MQKSSKGKWKQISLDLPSKSLTINNISPEALIKPIYSFAPKRNVLDWMIQRGRKLFRETMLPVGYPHSVHPNFLPFNTWNFGQSVAGSANGVLATQCLLVGLGLAGSANGSLAMAATLSWILKDGLGQLGGILFVARFGARFDRGVKKYRLLASAMMSLASFFEMLVPMMPGLFLPIAAAANVCKNVAWMGMSATKAQINRHFSLIDNMGDLTGKSASLNTTASLAGTGLGVLLSSSCLGSSSLLPAELVTRCLILSLPLTMFYLYASYKTCLLAVSPRLSLQRLDIIMKGLVPYIVKPSGRLIPEASSELHRYILDPARTGYKERFLPWSKNPTLIRFEPTFDGHLFPNNGDPVEAFEFYKEHGYAACMAEKKASIWFDEHAGNKQILKGILSCYIADAIQSGSWFGRLGMASKLANELEEKGLFEAMESRGWQVKEGLHLGRSPLSASDKLD